MAETKTHPAQHPVEVLGLTDTVSPSKGLRIMWRVFLIGTETPWQMTFALISTLFAATSTGLPLRCSRSATSPSSGATPS